MAANEELEEHVHRAKEPFEKMVAATMAIIAALLAIVSVLGTHFQTETILDQQQASDRWSYYQAKDIRRYTAAVAADALSEIKAQPTLVNKYSADAEKYDQQRATIQEEAQHLERERDRSENKFNRFHMGEVFLEVAIVFSSLAILTKRKPMFMAGVFTSLIGIVIAITAFML